VTDVDPDDIAYIGNEEDIRAPGCLLGLSVIFTFFAVLGSVAPWLWLVAAGFFFGKDRNGLIDALIGTPFILYVWAISIFLGGFGLGIGLFVAKNARYADHPKLARWGLVSSVVSAIAVLFVVTNLLIITLHILNR
jgi:hypothetical protein